MQRRKLIKALTLSSAVAAMGLSWTIQAAETIKVGILHSLSGTMAISETSLKDMALMTIEEINAKGGVLGKQLEPVVVDPASPPSPPSSSSSTPPPATSPPSSPPASSPAPSSPSS